MNILALILANLPNLLNVAEGLFSFKQKSGADKKAFVSNTLKTVVGSVSTMSTGGQAHTWEKIGPTIDGLIDVSVELANHAGAFEEDLADESTRGQI